MVIGADPRGSWVSVGSYRGTPSALLRLSLLFPDPVPLRLPAPLPLPLLPFNDTAASAASASAFRVARAIASFSELRNDRPIEETVSPFPLPLVDRLS